jgi:hypothetical protein
MRHMEILDKDTTINFSRVLEIVYWAKKWEISPTQLLLAFQKTHSNSIAKIKEYLREKGFAL